MMVRALLQVGVHTVCAGFVCFADGGCCGTAACV